MKPLLIMQVECNTLNRTIFDRDYNHNTNGQYVNINQQKSSNDLWQFKYHTQKTLGIRF